MKVKGKICLSARGNTKYTEPGKALELEVGKYWGFEKLGEVRVSDYGAVEMVLAIVEVEIEMPEQYLALTSDELMFKAFHIEETNLRAQFAQAITEHQARVQSFLALPNEAEKNDDDLPF